VFSSISCFYQSYIYPVMKREWWFKELATTYSFFIIVNDFFLIGGLSFTPLISSQWRVGCSLHTQPQTEKPRILHNNKKRIHPKIFPHYSTLRFTKKKSCVHDIARSTLVQFPFHFWIHNYSIHVFHGLKVFVHELCFPIFF